MAIPSTLRESTGGKDRLSGISKQGNRYLRWLLVAGAMAVIRYARQRGTKRLWLMRIMERRPIKVAAVARGLIFTELARA
jgi:transposase